MSVTSVGTRISQIEAMLGAVGGPTAPTASGFAQQLQQAGQAFGPSPAPPAQGNGRYDSLINAAAAKYGVDPALLKGLIRQESGFDSSSTSGAGAVGLTQLMPGTAAALGVTNPSDPAQSIDAGAHYLRQQLDSFGGDVQKALAAYNAGPGAVQRYGGVPPYSETQDYVRKVMAYADQYRGSQPQVA
jgi:soluble lytic murein transglycosylase-like protein